jgi:cytochrome c-type biogenesis protein CcmE
MEHTMTHPAKSANRTKFLIGGALIIAAIIYLIVSSTQSNAEYFLTIDELKARGASAMNQDVRVSGAVIGDSIQYDAQTLTLRFEVANVPADNKLIDQQGGLANALHLAVTDPTRTHMQVVYTGVKPDLLKNEAQAIMTGKLGQDGVFHASELLLKCPTKYEQALPAQSTSG